LDAFRIKPSLILADAPAANVVATFDWNAQLAIA
jgi:hypothetical protein